MAVSSAGQIALPKRVRDASGRNPGSAPSAEMQPDEVAVRNEVTEAALYRWRGHLKERSGGRSADDIIAELRGQ